MAIGTMLDLLMKSVFKSKVKKEIFISLKKSDKTISQLQKEIKVDGKTFNYRTIWQHIQSLEKDGFVLTEKKDHESGKPVYVKLSPLLSAVELKK